jgi:transcriptional regulator GlxA family with amidase domain
MSDKQRNVAIFIFDDVEVLDFAGPFEVFNVTGEVNDLVPFNTYTVALTEEPIKARGKLSINPQYSIDSCPTPDIILLPGGDGRRRLMKDERVLRWIARHIDNLEKLLSVCTGAFYISYSGLLNGLSATTHHGAFSEFRESFPDIELIEDKRYVENGKIITAGGISAGIDMSLYVVAQLLGEEKLALTLEEMEWQWHQDC